MKLGTFIRSQAKGVAPGTMTTYYGVNAQRLVFDGNDMWAAGGSAITKITSAGVLTPYSVGTTNAHGITFDGTNLWVVDYTSGGQLRRISRSGTVLNTYSLPANFGDSTIYDGVDSVWTSVGGYMVKTVVATGAATNYTTGTSVNTHSVLAGGYVWFCCPNDSKFGRINISTGAVNTYTGAAFQTGAITFDGTYLWITQSGGAFPLGGVKIAKADLSGNVLNTYTTLYGLASPDAVFDGTYVWVGGAGNYSEYYSKLNRVSADGSVLLFDLPQNSDPTGLAFDNVRKYVWSGNPGTGSVSKIKTG